MDSVILAIFINPGNVFRQKGLGSLELSLIPFINSLYLPGGPENNDPARSVIEKQLRG